jgi:Nitrile hydratase, alpha chain
MEGIEAMQEQNQQQAEACRRIVAKAWTDEAYKQRLLNEPALLLREEGLVVVDGVEVRAVENTEKVRYVVLPAKPAELTEARLEAIAGGQSPMLDPNNPYLAQAQERFHTQSQNISRELNQIQNTLGQAGQPRYP